MHRRLARRALLGQFAPRLPQAYEYPAHVTQVAPPAPVPTRPYWIPGYVAPSAVATAAAAGVAPVSRPRNGGISLSIRIENQSMTTVTSPGDAASYVIANSQPGDRVAVIDDRTGAQSYLLRTPSAVVAVPPDIQSQVESMPRDEVLAQAIAAEDAVRAKKPSGGFPWLVLVPVALAVL